jgi:3-oxoacyl-[acyl-carrier-protein] synthase-1
MRLFDGMHPNEFRVDNILCDMNGEPYRAEEYAFASLRTDSYFADSSHFIAPADCWGDVGAASGPLLVGLAVEGHAKGYLAGSRTLVWTSSEGGDRAAAIIGLAGR